MAIFDILKKSKKESVRKGEKERRQPKVKKKLVQKKEKEKKAKQSLDDVLRESALSSQMRGEPTSPRLQRGEPARPMKKVEKKHFSDAWQVLHSAHITEKSTALSEQGAYVFKVKPFAGKQEIKKAVRDLYGVNVEDVRIVNVPRKSRRLGRSQGFKSGYKKAIVKLSQGEKIEIMPR